MATNTEYSYIMDFISEYYDGKLPSSFSKDEQYRLIISAQAGDCESRNKLLESYFKLIFKIAKKNNRPGTEIEDLFQEGVIGCIKAIDTFKLELDYTFTTYASTVIRNEIAMFVRSLKLQRNLKSLDEPIYINSDGEEVYLLDSLVDDTISADPEQYAEMIIIKDVVESEMNKLNVRDRQIIEYRFGLNNKPKLTQIQISKIMGCTRSNICRIIRRNLSKMRTEIEFKLH